MLRMLLPAVAALSLAGCLTDIADSKRVNLSATQIDQIKGAAVADFFDPNSAEFRNIRAVDATLTNGATIRRVCGEVNGKNLNGAYTGFTWFGGQMVNGKFTRKDFAGACE